MIAIVRATVQSLRAQVDALAAQLDATLALLAALEEAAPPPGDGPCAHPEDRQRDARTFTEPNLVLCLDCGVKHVGSAG